MASGPSFESDLRAIREARGLSLTEIHQHTRIPVDVLRRFEEGDLVQDPTYNEVYLKAFMQSYAKAIGVPAGAVLVAYEDQKAGAYRGALHPSGDAEPDEAPAEEAPADPPAPDAPSEAAPAAPAATAPAPSTPEAAAPTPAEPPASKAPASTAPPAVAALKKTPDPEAAKSSGPPKTLAEARGSRPAIPTTDKTFDRNWSTIVGLLVVVLVLIAGALWLLVSSGDDEPESDLAVTEVEDVATDSDSAAAAPLAPTGPAFQLPMQVGITAGGDGLQSFRVRVDDDVPRPYWVEIGDTQTFEADSLIVLQGEDPSQDFSESTITLQGLEFTPPNGRDFVISAANGQAVLDSLAAR